jgi:hypothetical protein
MAGRGLGKQSGNSRAGRAADLQERDLALFEALRKAKVLTVSDIVPLYFPSVAMARRRLKKLMDSGYLAGYCNALHEETRYVLDRKGQIALFEDLGLDERPRSAPAEYSGPGDHHLMNVRFWSRVVAECELSRGVRLVRYQFEWELDQAHLPTILKYRPDAVLTIEDVERRRSFVVEIDTGTEGPQYVAENKIAFFARMHAARMEIAGVVPDGMLIVAKSVKRLAALGRQAVDIGGPVFGRVLDLKAEPVNYALTSGWYRLADLGEREVEAQSGAVVRVRAPDERDAPRRG